MTVTKEAEAFALQNEISDVMKSEMPLLLQDVFDSVSSGDDIIRIDSLHLDLGTLPEQNTGQVFKDRLIEKIKEAIVTKKENSTSENGVRVVHAEQSLREAFLFFLEHGTTPWFTGVKKRSDWESEMQVRFAEKDWRKIVLWLRRNHHYRPVIIERLVCQFSEAFLESIISHAIPFDKEAWKEVYDDLLRLYNRENNRSDIYLPRGIYRLCFSSILNERTMQDALLRVVKESMVNDDLSLRILSPGSLHSSRDNMKSKALTEALERIRSEESRSLKRHDEETIKSDKGSKGLLPGENAYPPFADNRAQSGTDDDSMSNRDREETVDGYNQVSDEFKRKESQSKNVKDLAKGDAGGNEEARLKKKNTNQIEREPQYVSHAGIVLLHPFLETYFNESGLLNKRKFRDDNACKRAVLLLHHLATGETEGEEWNLLLQKMMCGLSYEETLPNHIELSDKEKEESEQLLQSVINYCPPLKNTSVTGLRSTFLQREGRLEKKENGWLLTMEQKTVDILLDKLPWGFSTIKFPWLTDLINVDWC